MSKFKIEHSAGQKLLVIQGQKGQQISEREYYAINNGQIPGLLRAELIRQGSSFRLNYNISGFISLREFLVNPLNKMSFARLLGNILTNLKALQSSYYNHQFILMDMNAAMVNPTTQQVSFVYVPITFYESGTNLKEFLLSIIQCCSFVPGENTDYVRDYIRILNNGINFSVFDLEEYVKNLKVDEKNSDTSKKCTRCGNVIQPNVNFCSSCGMKISGLNSSNPQGVYDPAKIIFTPPKIDEGVNYGVVDTPPIYSETISSSCITDVSQPQSQQTATQPKTAVIYRLRTGEQIRITSESFRIGKDPHNCEYCIRDNSAISRCHAIIKQINGKWFINDLNSTNKTYVSERMIHPHMDIELLSGMNFKLANEDFVFNLY